MNRSKSAPIAGLVLALAMTALALWLVNKGPSMVEEFMSGLLGFAYSLRS